MVSENKRTSTVSRDNQNYEKNNTREQKQGQKANTKWANSFKEETGEIYGNVFKL